jgi:hypothetical protein
MCAGLLLQLRQSIRVQDRVVTVQDMETLPLHRALVLFETVMFDAACQMQVKIPAFSYCKQSEFCALCPTEIIGTAQYRFVTIYRTLFTM